MERAVRKLLMGGVSLLFLAHPPRAMAHLLDAYLQAAQITIDPEQVTLDLYLTPGVQIARGLIGGLDSDHDGSVSAAECHRYAEAILPRLTLSADGKPLTLQLTASDSASIEELRQGLGSLHLKAVAQLTDLRVGEHSVRFENAFRPAGSLYVANAMLPRDQRIVIRKQNRDSLQTSIDIAYDLRAPRTELFLRGGSVVLAAGCASAIWWVAVFRRHAKRDISA